MFFWEKHPLSLTGRGITDTIRINRKDKAYIFKNKCRFRVLLANYLEKNKQINEKLNCYLVQTLSLDNVNEINVEVH